MAEGIDVHEATESERESAFELRRAVFCVEQGFFPELEIDEHDDTAVHLVATRDGMVVGTLRWRPYGDTGLVKVERVAVVRAERGAGIGRALMAAALARLDAIQQESMLHAVIPARTFYEQLGYEADGETFLEEEVPHIRMRRPVPRP